MSSSCSWNNENKNLIRVFGLSTFVIFINITAFVLSFHLWPDFGLLLQVYHHQKKKEVVFSTAGTGCLNFPVTDSAASFGKDKCMLDTNQDATSKYHLRTLNENHINISVTFKSSTAMLIKS